MENEIKEYDVTFGQVSPQKETVRLAMKFDRTVLSPEEADKLFCGSQVSAKIAVDNNAGNDDPGQEKSINTDFELSLNGTSKRYSVDPKQVSVSLTMTYSEELAKKLIHFGFRKGKIKCHRTGNAPEKDAKDSGEESTLYEGTDEPSES